MVEWLSSVKEKDLNDCGKLVLAGDMSTLSITKVDLSNMNTLEGKLCCLKCSCGSSLNVGFCAKKIMLVGCCPKATPNEPF